MAALDLEAEYNNRTRVPDHADIFARWERDAKAYRDHAAAENRAELGLSYGPSARQTIDIFRPAADGKAPLTLFIHGGYWRSLAPSMFSHMAAGLNAHGVTVAVAGYDLCPQVSIAEIIRQIREACAFVYGRFGQRMLVIGHSAGGHLAACMVATDWASVDKTLPPQLTPAGISISGVFDLEPLVSVSMNADLKLDDAEARRASPIHWPVGADRVFDALVGARESSEFLRQSRGIADTWDAAGAATRYEEVPGGNHFTALDPLADPASAMVARAVTLASRLG